MERNGREAEVHAREQRRDGHRRSCPRGQHGRKRHGDGGQHRPAHRAERGGDAERGHAQRQRQQRRIIRAGQPRRGRQRKHGGRARTHDGAPQQPRVTQAGAALRTQPHDEAPAESDEHARAAPCIAPPRRIDGEHTTDQHREECGERRRRCGHGGIACFVAHAALHRPAFGMLRGDGFARAASRRARGGHEHGPSRLAADAGPPRRRGGVREGGHVSGRG